MIYISIPAQRFPKVCDQSEQNEVVVTLAMFLYILCVCPASHLDWTTGLQSLR